MHSPDRILNDLIATCRDSAEGFGKAAKGAHSDQLREQLTDIERSRSDFADQLADLARNLGFEPETTGHIGEILHRGWVDLETRIRPETDGHLIEGCRRGEEGTLRHFESALGREEFPAGARGLVEQQREQIREDLEKLGAATSSAARTSI
jgi:uncharacterized protein (TIGR02284 family)